MKRSRTFLSVLPALSALAVLSLGACATDPKPATALAAPSSAAAAPAGFAAAAAAKPDVTIVVTDSGLGGLSVVADLASRLPASGSSRGFGRSPPTPGRGSGRSPSTGWSATSTTA